MVLTAIYTDETRQGSSIIGRSQFLDMIKYFESPACLDQGVVMWKFSGFLRDLDDSKYYRSLLRVRGNIVHTIQDDVPDNDFGSLIETMIDLG